MKPPRIVVDANVLMSAFLRDGMTRELLLHAPVELFAPPWLRHEVENTLFKVAERRGVPTAVAHALLDRLMERIQEVPQALVAVHAQALRRCSRSGAKDAPYVACALAVDAALWTHDRRLTKEADVQVVSTNDLHEKFSA